MTSQASVPGSDSGRAEAVTYPNVWSAGGLFAFSGLDGPTDYYHPLVASLLEDEVGLRLHTDPPMEAYWPLQPGELDRGRCVVANDVLELCRQGQAEPVLSLAFLDKDTLVGRGEPPVLRPGSRGPTFVQSPPFALAVAQGGGCFCLAAAAAAEDAAAKAEAGLAADVDGVVGQRKAFFAHLDWAPAAGPEVRATYAKAWSVLKCNVYAPQAELETFWTTPDRWPHRHMWLWDSAFHALAWRRYPGSIGADAVCAMLRRQAADGFVPYRVGPDSSLPAPIMLPPVLAWSVWKVYSMTGDREMLAWAYPRLGRYVDWAVAHRDDGDGLLRWTRTERQTRGCDESGQDNSSRFDGPELPIPPDFNAMMAAEYEALARMAHVLGREDEAAAWLARHRGLAERIEERLWSEEHGLYLDRFEDGFANAVRNIVSFYPMYAGVASPARAARMVAELQRPESFWRALPVPSVAADEPSYSDDCWRGPVWLNTSYLVIEGLLRYGYVAQARHIAERIVAEVRRWYGQGGCIYEYYDPEARRSPWALSRKGNTSIGVIHDFGWSAAIFIELVHFLAGEQIGT